MCLGGRAACGATRLGHSVPQPRRVGISPLHVCLVRASTDCPCSAARFCATAAGAGGLWRGAELGGGHCAVGLKAHLTMVAAFVMDGAARWRLGLLGVHKVAGWRVGGVRRDWFGSSTQAHGQHVHTLERACATPCCCLASARWQPRCSGCGGGARGAGAVGRPAVLAVHLGRAFPLCMHAGLRGLAWLGGSFFHAATWQRAARCCENLLTAVLLLEGTATFVLHLFAEIGAWPGWALFVGGRRGPPLLAEERLRRPMLAVRIGSSPAGMTEATKAVG